MADRARDYSTVVEPNVSDFNARAQGADGDVTYYTVVPRGGPADAGL